MENKMYINGIASISAQLEQDVFENNPQRYHQNIFPAVSPKYKEYIPAMALRRMSKAVKMGLTTALAALKEAEVSNPGAIITGTGQGCKQDTEKFLKTFLEQEEGLLAPTSFIQSTHNTVGGQIAMHLKCHEYNVTYTQNSGSLEAALIDASLQFEEDPQQESVLVGGIDELSDKFTSFLYLDGQLKEKQITNTDLFTTNSPGTITSEGAHFFTISATQKPGSYARLVDVSVFSSTASEDVSTKIKEFLSINHCDLKEVDVLISGNNGDSRYDFFYQDLQKGMFKEKQQLVYKHLTGDYNTVSGYAVWLGCKILKQQTIPEPFKLNHIPEKPIKHILIYNQYLGENHSIILLGAP